MLPKLIAITGGIGTGKSVVSRCLRTMGWPVYDCDLRTKQLMNHHPILRAALAEAFGMETYLPDGSLNRPYLAQRIFSDSTMQQKMNALVHPYTLQDLQLWHAEQNTSVAFYESAILFESGFNRHADAIWCVSAPLQLRIERIAQRDHATPQQILARIESQMPQEEKEKMSDIVIINDAEHSIIEQLNSLL